jgi:hypothetical protein
MLQLRYGDKLKDRIRSVLYRLNEMGVPGKPIPEAYAMIAAMHAEGLRFLSLPVLAEHFGMTISEFHKNVVVPLAAEAVVAGGGRFVLCRHSAIAKASVAVLRETNLFGDVDTVYSELSRAAIGARASCFCIESGTGFPNRGDFDSTCWLGGGQQGCRSHTHRTCVTV